MTDPIPQTGLTVEPSAFATQVKAQLRIVLAALAGAILGRLVDRGILPDWLAGDGTAELIVGVLLYAIPSIWQWWRVRLQHLRLWGLALSRRVPDDMIRVADPPVGQSVGVNAPIARDRPPPPPSEND